MAALLWRGEQAGNALKLRGDPTVDADSVMFRVMFAPSVGPVEVVQARELFRPPPPLPAPAPVEPGEDPLDAGASGAGVRAGGRGSGGRAGAREAATPSKRVRKRPSKRR